jgi:hypothetical protein
MPTIEMRMRSLDAGGAQGVDEVLGLGGVGAAPAGSQVEHGVDAVEGIAEAGGVGQVAGGEAGAASAAEDSDVVPGRAQAGGRRPAEGAGAAGDEDLHDYSPE